MAKSARKTAKTATTPFAMVAKKAGGASVFAKQAIELARPKAGEVLIRHTAIGVNFIDVYQRSGLYPAPGGYPSILGSEAARSQPFFDPEIVRGEIGRAHV